MKVVSFIEDKEVIERILQHIGLIRNAHKICVTEYEEAS
jgi:hypothetical protein